MRLPALAVAILFSLPLPAATYYISASGSDANNGTSPDRAWKTIARVMSSSYAAGDVILFEGGQTFSGSLFFDPSNSTPAAAAPITIGSYGTGRATIASGREIGINIRNVSGVQVSSLRITGDAANSGASGIAVISDAGVTMTFFHLGDVEISGYTNGFIAIVTTPASKIRGIRIVRAAIHDNALGAVFYGYTDRPAAANNFEYGIGEISIADSASYRNKGGGLQGGYGGGIFMINVDNVVIERSQVYDNGGDNPELTPNGPSAITVYDGRNVVIQENEVRGQRYDVQNQTDNGGIDMWALDSVIQYNYVHDNEGWGLILGGADPALGVPLNNWPSRNNTFRYNVISNNARPLSDTEATGPFHGAQVLMFGELENFEFYNNTFFAGGRTSGVHPDAVQGMIYLIDVPGTGKPWSQIRFRNNLLIAEEDATFLDIPRPAAGSGLLFDNNAYLTLRAIQPVKWGGVTFDTIAAWTAATGQDPRALIGSSTMLCRLAPRPAAPVIDAGLDLRSLGISVGTRDNRGRPVPAGNGFDIGAIEYQPGDTCGRHRSVRK